LLILQKLNKKLNYNNINYTIKLLIKHINKTIKMSENNDISLLMKEIKDMKEKLEKQDILIKSLEVNLDILNENDIKSRNAISNLQNFFLGLFKKFLSKLTKTPEEKTNIIQWTGIKEIMCNNPDHLQKFVVRNIKYCGSDPTCPSCRSKTQEFNINSFNEEFANEFDD